MLSRLLAVAMMLAATWSLPGPARAAPSTLDDNADSVAVVIGNRDYKQTVPVDFAANDADAMRDYLVRSLGFRAENVFLLKDATLNEFNQVFGTERNPQSGRLWRSVREGRSNVFVYYSGHGVPDLVTRQPYLLPADGNPNQSESGYLIETLYRNLELVRAKIGGERQLVVMIDACFTGETGRRGETLFAVSAPGFAPARPKSANDLVKLVATSGATPANWDETNRLGLFTSRFLMGVSGLADAGPAGDGVIGWPELKRYVTREVAAAARRDTGRDQVPEIDDAPITLRASAPVPAIARGVATARDEASWRVAELSGTRDGFERYVGTCGEVCAFRERAMGRLFEGRQRDDAARDQESWARLGGAKQYQAYLETCRETCAYRSLAETYLGTTNPDADPRVQRCDEMAAASDDPDKPPKVRGTKLGRIETAAIEICRSAVQAHPKVRRLSYELGRALDKAERYKDAFAAYKAAADAGSVGGLNNLATLHENGQGVKVSLADAFRLYREAAEGGNRTAMSNAGRLLEYGRGVPKNEAEALRWYQRAADAGDTQSITKLVPYYVSGGPGIPRDPQKGFDLFRRAADRGDPMAMATMATLIDNGFGGFFPDMRSTELVMKALTKGEEGAAFVSATDTAKQKLRPDTIRTVQARLKQEQYYSGAIDGRFNPVFVRALDLYARSREQ